jgi:hypothetical protein
MICAAKDEALYKSAAVLYTATDKTAALLSFFPLKMFFF